MAKYLNYTADEKNKIILFHFKIVQKFYKKNIFS